LKPNSSEFCEDGHIAYVSISKAQTLIDNALARLSLQLVLLVGLKNIQKSYFQFLPQKVRLGRIDKIENIDQKIQF